MVVLTRTQNIVITQTCFRQSFRLCAFIFNARICNEVGFLKIKGVGVQRREIKNNNKKPKF